jgi:hypothetical protein
MRSFDQARAAWRSAATLQIIGLVCLTLDAAFWQTSHGRVLPAYLVALGVMAALLLALVARRRRPSEALSALAVLAHTAAVLVALWTADEVLAREPRLWIPFQSHKLAVLALALVAPAPFWVGVVCIAAYTLAAAVQYVSFDPAVRAHLAWGEPWGSLAFGVIAVGILLHRRRLLQMEHEAMRAQAETESLRRLARVALAVRDLSNTPLQTLELATALLRLRHPESAALLDQTDRSLARLEQLDGVLSRYEAQTEWAPGDTSFDPLALLEDRHDRAAPLEPQRRPGEARRAEHGGSSAGPDARPWRYLATR